MTRSVKGNLHPIWPPGVWKCNPFVSIAWDQMEWLPGTRICGCVGCPCPIPSPTIPPTVPSVMATSTATPKEDNAMNPSKVVKIFDGFTVLCFVLLLGVTYNRNSGTPSSFCLHCKAELTTGHSCSQCIMYHWNGRKECYCCPHCTFPEKVRETKLGYQIQKMTVKDFETRKGINCFQSLLSRR